MDLEALATTKGDFHLASFIQEKFLRKQVMLYIPHNPLISFYSINQFLISHIAMFNAIYPIILITSIFDQVLDLKMIGDFLTKIKRVGTGLGVHMLDRDLAAFIQTRRANQIVKAFKARNYMAEEDVNNISHIERENLANIFMERLFL